MPILQSVASPELIDYFVYFQVVKAYDHKTQQHIALKIVRNEKRFHRQAAEEIRILEHLRKQDKVNVYSVILIDIIP